MAITLTGGATFVGGANIGTLPEPPPPVPPSEISLLTQEPFNNGGGDIAVTDEGNGTFFLKCPSVATNGTQTAYASDAGKTSGKWYFFAEHFSSTVSNTGIVLESGGSFYIRVGLFADASELNVNAPRVIYVDVDAKTYAIDDLSGTELKTATFTGSGTFYFGLTIHKPSEHALGEARISFDTNYASATLRPGYSILTG